MTLKVYGFYEIGAQVDHTNSGIAPIGELSPFGKTFVPADGTYPWIDVDAGNQNAIHHISTDDAAWDNLTDVTLSGIRPLLTALNAKLTSSNFFSGINAPATLIWVSGLLNGPISGGSVVVDSVSGSEPLLNTNNIVEYVELTVTQNITAKTFKFYLWLSDGRFQIEYPLGYFNVVPPITNP